MAHERRDDIHTHQARSLEDLRLNQRCDLHRQSLQHFHFAQRAPRRRRHVQHRHHRLNARRQRRRHSSSLISTISTISSTPIRRILPQFARQLRLREERGLVRLLHREKHGMNQLADVLRGHEPQHHVGEQIVHAEQIGLLLHRERLVHLLVEIEHVHVRVRRTQHLEGRRQVHDRLLLHDLHVLLREHVHAAHVGNVARGVHVRRVHGGEDRVACARKHGLERRGGCLGRRSHYRAGRRRVGTEIGVRCAFGEELARSVRGLFENVVFLVDRGGIARDVVR